MLPPVTAGIGVWLDGVGRAATYGAVERMNGRTTNIIRITDFSYPRPFVPNNERSLWRTFVPQERKFQVNFRSRDLSFPGTFVLGERKFPGTFVPGPFRSPGTFVPGERKFQSFLGPFVPGNFRSHYPIGLVAPLLCVLNYCMFGCDFTLMMLTPL